MLVELVCSDFASINKHLAGTRSLVVMTAKPWA